jgi:hypothetical protein
MAVASQPGDRGVDANSSSLNRNEPSARVSTPETTTCGQSSRNGYQLMTTNTEMAMMASDRATSTPG